MGCVDEVAMDANRFLNYQRQYQKQLIQKQQYLQKRVSKSLSLSLSPFHSLFSIEIKITFSVLNTIQLPIDTNYFLKVVLYMYKRHICCHLIIHKFLIL